MIELKAEWRQNRRLSYRDNITFCYHEGPTTATYLEMGELPDSDGGDDSIDISLILGAEPIGHVLITQSPITKQSFL
jgi:hypothetical protein